mgnify:CR=1 FL=1
MFLDLQIKTDQGWQKTILPPDASISIEDINPLFDTEAGGAFSYPFTISVEANQHLFPTVTNHHGAQVYDLIYHKPFRLSAGGYPLLYGIIDLDEEVEIAEKEDGTHTVAINLASNNQELSTRLEGVNAQDIPLKDRIPVGTEFRYLDWTLEVEYNGTNYYSKCRTAIPPKVFSINSYKTSLDGSGNWINSTNVQDPYPQKAYCNARIAIQAREKQSDGSYTTLREYEIFDADRPNSGICFYVQYFLDCLFFHYDIVWDNSRLSAFEDFNRLAYFTTKCECDAISTAASYTHAQMRRLLPDLKLLKIGTVTEFFDEEEETYTANAWTKYANSKNFPDTDALNIIKEIQNAFGVRFIYDSEGQRCKAIFLKDVFRDKTAVKSGAIVHSAYHADKNIQGVKMTYGGGEDDTNYNYDPSKDNSPVVIKSSYNYIKDKKDAYDNNTYYDSTTGDMYRIKVDDDAKTEEEWHPSLFEVGQFHDAWVGDITDKNLTQEVQVQFTPVVCNVVNTIESAESDENSDETRKRTSVLGKDTEIQDQSDCKYAVFIDLEIEEETETRLLIPFSEQSWAKRDGSGSMIFGTSDTFGIKFVGRYGYASSYVEKNNEYAKKMGTARSRDGIEKPIVRYDEDPLATYNAGFSLGIMRGPGNDAGADIVRDNYDGNGNAQWAYTPTGYAFTSDSIDQYGNAFDYNGESEGGIVLDQRFSLKLQAEKVLRFQGEKTGDNAVLVKKPKEAAYWMSYLFPDSNADLLSLRPQLKSVIQQKGWDVTGLPDVVYILPKIANGKMCNVIQADGTVLTSSELDAYTTNQGRVSGNNNDATRRDPQNIIIKLDATQSDIQNLVALAGIYYNPDTSEPYTLTDIPATATTDFYPIDSTNSHRGLLHKFNYEYFWFLIHARLITLVLTMELDELLHLDKTCWHTFGQYTGLIKNISYKLSENGLSQIKIGLYYL